MCLKSKMQREYDKLPQELRNRFELRSIGEDHIYVGYKHRFGHPIRPEEDKTFEQVVHTWLEDTDRDEKRLQAQGGVFYPYICYHIVIQVNVSKYHRSEEMYSIHPEPDELGFWLDIHGRQDTKVDKNRPIIVHRNYIRWDSDMNAHNATLKQTEWGYIHIPPPGAERLGEEDD